MKISTIALRVMGVTALGLALVSRTGAAQEKVPVGPDGPPLTVAFEIVVSDARGRPVTDIRAEEVEVVQDAAKQKIRTFHVGSRPGLYEITYVPASGKPGGVSARVTRLGTVIKGPDGPALKPRVISALSPLETELNGYLDARAGANELACDVAVYRFEAGPKGVRHAIAVEIPLSVLRFYRLAEGGRGRLQILARITPLGRPDARQYVSLDQVLEAADDKAVDLGRLVWTGTAVIGPGSYTVDVLVRDPSTELMTTRTLAVEVPAATPGVASSSVVLLRPREFFFLRDRAEGDDPLVYEGAPLMPNLRPMLFAGAETYLRFFVAVYPTAGRADAVTLNAELLRDGTKIAEAPIKVPTPEPSGEIRYLGQLATSSFPAGSYRLRLVASQGQTTTAQEAAFVISSSGAPRRIN